MSSVTAVGGLHGMYKTAVPAGSTVPCAVQICTDFWFPMRNLERLFSVVNSARSHLSRSMFV